MPVFYVKKAINFVRRTKPNLMPPNECKQHITHAHMHTHGWKHVCTQGADRQMNTERGSEKKRERTERKTD